MQYRQLGSSALVVSEISLGSWLTYSKSWGGLLAAHPAYADKAFIQTAGRCQQARRRPGRTLAECAAGWQFSVGR